MMIDDDLRNVNQHLFKRKHGDRNRIMTGIILYGAVSFDVLTTFAKCSIQRGNCQFIYKLIYL